MNNRPPKLPLRFLRWFCHPDLLPSIEGDLIELYEEKTSQGRNRFLANLYFTKEVIKLFRPGIAKKLEGSIKLNYYGMFKHNIKIGWRNILKNKTHSLINILGLSTGAAMCLVTLVFYRYETTFDQHHELADKTFRMVQHNQMPDGETYWNTTAYPLAAALRTDFPDFAQVTQTAGPMKRLFSVENENIRFEEDHVLFVDEHYPRVFDFDWIAGNPETALKNPDAVVITERIARKCLKDQHDLSQAVGKTLLLNNNDPLIISGIIKNPPPNINLKSNMLVSYEFFKKHNPYPTGNWSGNYRGTTFVVLSNPEIKSKIETQINVWKNKYLNEVDNQRISYFLQPISEIHTEPKYGTVPGGYQIAQRILNISLIVVGFILLIAILNFINLVTAKAATRSKEVGIKKIIGGTKSVILNQFFIENSLLVIISLALAVLITIPILDWLNDLLSIINIHLALSINDLLIALVLCFGVILLASTYPAILLSSFKPMSILSKSFFKTRKAGLGLRRGLTLAQFSIVQVFLISAIIVGLQLRYFQNRELGFSSEKMVTIPIPSSQGTEVLKAKLTSISGIDQIAIGSTPPMAVGDFALGTKYRLAHEGELEGRAAEMKTADSSYINMYGLQLIAGRNFKENKPRFDEFIVNRRFAESLNLNPEEAIGRDIIINEGQATIVGVIEDFHNHSLQNDFTPVVLMNWESWMWQAFVKIPSFATMIEVEEAWKEVFPTSIFNYSFLDDSIKREYMIEQLIFTGFKVFSVLVILIGCLGLFGLISFLTIQKTKEVGIRKVLGASMIQILSLFTKEYSRLILIAFLLATPLAWYFMSEWLNSFKYHISLEVWMFIAGGIIALGLAGLVTFSRSIAASQANPVESLRSE